jgi:hypothetical protein
MDLKYTSHQVPRGSRPDAETFDRLYLIKKVSVLRATYQIRLLAFFAQEKNKNLVLKVPRECEFHSSLKGLIRILKNTIQRENF